MKVTIGTRVVVASTTILVPKGESAWLEFRADDWNVKLNLVFEDNAEKAEPSTQLVARDDHASLTFTNWNSSLPTAVIHPHSIGLSGGKTLQFVGSGIDLGGAKQLFLQFFWEPA